MIKYYKTNIPNFYMFISHGVKGNTNCSYGLISDDGNKMIEVEPQHGPITTLEHDDILTAYINDFSSLDRGHWNQRAFDELELSKSFSEGNFEYICSALSDWL